MIERNGDLFDTEAGIIAHGVNCQGIMGAGIAKQFRDRFYHMHKTYQRHCEDETLKPGGFFAFYDLPTQWLIVNLATQDLPGANASYEWLYNSLMAFVSQITERRIESYGNIIAIPEIGCGIGGLEWPIVELHLKAIEGVYPQIEFEVWHYEG